MPALFRSVYDVINLYGKPDRAQVVGVIWSRVEPHIVRRVPLGEQVGLCRSPDGDAV